MDIRIKESLVISVKGLDYIVRSGTIGIEKKRIVYFYDNTRSVSVGFPRDVCVNTPVMFSVSRTLTDREVSIKDVLEVIEQMEDGGYLSSAIRSELTERVRAL